MRVALALLIPPLLIAQSALLEIKVIEGAGATYAAGSRTPGLTVEVADELGRPVSGAVVSIRLPDDGAGGSFANGLSSEILTTGTKGRATTSAIRWGSIPGAVEIQITAVNGKLRAGTVATCQISDGVAGKHGASPRRGSGPQPIPLHKHGFLSKWMVVGLVAAAAAAGAGVAVSRSGGSSGGSSNNPGGSTGGITIGSPDISIGQP